MPDANRLQWLRGGTSPEAQYVTFELSTNGGSGWTALGNGTRMAGGWELMGLNLSGTGMVRARARTSGGYGNASAGLVESTAGFTIISPLDTWRQTHFQTLQNLGDAADNADPDRDGLENLIEFAFDRDPKAASSLALPAWQIEDDDYVLNFTSPALAGGVTYIAERSTHRGSRELDPDFEQFRIAKLRVLRFGRGHPPFPPDAGDVSLAFAEGGPRSAPV